MKLINLLLGKRVRVWPSVIPGKPMLIVVKVVNGWFSKPSGFIADAPAFLQYASELLTHEGGDFDPKVNLLPFAKTINLTNKALGNTKLPAWAVFEAQYQCAVVGKLLCESLQKAQQDIPEIKKSLIAEGKTEEEAIAEVKKRVEAAVGTSEFFYFSDNKPTVQ